jgi:hypothetical protein
LRKEPKVDTFVLRYQDAFVLEYRVVEGVYTILKTTPQKEIAKRLTYEEAKEVCNGLSWKLGLSIQIELY